MRVSRFTLSAIAVGLLLAAGCHIGPGIAHYAHPIRLTPEAPEDARERFRLLRVEPDRSALQKLAQMQ